MEVPESALIVNWLSQLRLERPMRVRQITLPECQQWSLEDGRLKHSSGGFFSVVGCRYLCESGHLYGFEQPMIDQPEVGILGFLVQRSGDNWEWLLQAKAEPGNIGVTQVGPTVQATYSNYMRLHGGHPTPMLNFFTGQTEGVCCLSDVEQSEQGDRFLGKYNRNSVMEVPQDATIMAGDLWRWVPAAALKEALHEDYLINTDARSVLFTSDWSSLCDSVDAEPFARWRDEGEFGARLRNSLRSAQGDVESVTAKARLIDARIQSSGEPQLVDLGDLREWVLDGHGIVSKEPGRDPVLSYYAVESPDREVSEWCQPLMASRSVGRVLLICASFDGVLKFLLRISLEPGFSERAQCGPSYVSGVAHGCSLELLRIADTERVKTHAQVMQSDEGGRFMRSVARYEICEVSNECACRLNDIEPDGMWLSLAALRRLALQKGMLTNEMRSVGSLLLKWC